MVESRQLVAVKLRTFIVESELWDVSMDLPPDLANSELPITYTVDWNASTKLVFHAPKIGMHFSILLAALDHLEACGELTMNIATFPVSQIMEV